MYIHTCMHCPRFITMYITITYIHAYMQLVCSHDIKGVCVCVCVCVCMCVCDFP